MNYRELGRTGWQVSEISFGAWAIGGAWGNVDDRESIAALHAALDGGVNFFDTADVSGFARKSFGGISGGPSVTRPLPSAGKLADKPAGSGRQTF